MTIDDIIGTPWDVVIAGTGLGGGTLGYALACGGMRVLFVEAGLDQQRHDAIAGDYPEVIAGTSPEALRRACRETLPIVDITRATPTAFVPFIGSGSGGSSALYGMALERFLPSDLSSWPVTYAELEPYYAQAESLYRVRGTPDPLRPAGAQYLPPSPLTPAAADLMEHLERRGLHPYQLPQACERIDGCDGCQSYVCAKACKNDSARVCLAPATTRHGAQLIDGCRVITVDASRSAVRGIVCERSGEALYIPCKRLVLAAGALHTPNILLRSRSVSWPQGLANRSGLVGRNLMRHLVDVYVMEAPKHATPADNRFKEIGCSDFYEVDGMKLGAVQSFGRLPPSVMLLAELEKTLRGARAGGLVPGLRLIQPWLRRQLDRLGAGIALATIVEDTPLLQNRVVPSANGNGITMTYALGPTELQRMRAMRRHMRRALEGRRYRLLAQSSNNQRVAHACGTCRSGRDPAAAVVDADNRAHGIGNLWIADTSFFPTSGGTNPGLTVAANALRVAERMLASG